MSPSKTLIQLDPDTHASSFDAVVAIDSEVDQLLQYAHVGPSDVRGLVYGAIFTRGVDDLSSTAIFIGGTDVAAGEALLKEVDKTFFGPMRVSVMLDANGANTTAAAAVTLAAKHLQLRETSALVLAGTGSVGQRAARLLAGAGAQVRVASRALDRSTNVCERVAEELQANLASAGSLTAVQTLDMEETRLALDGVQLVIAAGAAGVELLPLEIRHDCEALQLAIDLNAVPPLGIAGTQVTDKAVERNGVLCYGAIGVGGTKMKIHRAAIRKLFTASDLVLDAEQMMEIGRDSVED